MSTNPLHTVIKSLALLAVVALAAGCGKPTIEGAVSSYKSAKDKLDAVVAKVSPQMKMDIRAKIAEFQKEFKEAEAKGGEAAISAVHALTSRMNKYRNSVDPTAGKKGAKANAGGKLNKGNPGPGATAAPAPVGGKLNTTGGTAAPAKAGGSGFGSKGGTTPGPSPATRPAPKPATGGSGFGGK